MFNCTKCGKTLKSSKGQRRHELTCKRESSKCKHCKQTFSSNQALNNHEAKCQQKQKKAVASTTRKGANRNPSASNVEMRYTCALCDKQFGTLSAFHLHRRSHYEISTAEQKNMSCKQCSFKCNTRKELTSHLHTHDPHAPSTSNPSNGNDTEHNKATTPPLSIHKGSYKCIDCEEEFEKWYQLRHHRAIFHTGAECDFHWKGIPWEIDSSIRPPWETIETNEQGEEQIVVDAELKAVFEKNRATIGCGHDKGRVEGVYNYPINDYHDGDIHTLRLHMENIVECEDHAFRLNVSFGIILRNIETGAYKYYAPYYNAMVFDHPIRINHRRDLDAFITALEEKDLQQYLMKDADSTKWQKVFVSNVNSMVYRTGFPIGKPTGAKGVDDYIINHHCIVSMVSNPKTFKVYTDNLCFFRCLAYARTKSIYIERSTTLLYGEWKFHQENTGIEIPTNLKKFKGVTLDDLPILEELFDVSINVYNLQKDETCTKVYSSYLPADNDNEDPPLELNLNLHGNHFSVITRWNGYAKSFSCRNCAKLFDRVDNLKRHELSCTNKVNYKFPGGLYKPTRSMFEELEEDLGITVEQELQNFPYFAVYDFESVLLKIEQEPVVGLDGVSEATEDNGEVVEDHGENQDMNAEGEQGPKSRWITKHVPVCVSVCSNVEGYETPHSIVDTDIDGLVEKMVGYLQKIQTSVVDITKQRWQGVFHKLHQMGNKYPVSNDNDEDTDNDSVYNELLEREEDESDEMRNVRDQASTSKLMANRVAKLTEKFTKYTECLPVLGFNSSKYDLNLIKSRFPKHLNLVTDTDYVIKKCNQYSAIVTKSYRFLDISNYLAAGSSYSKFLAAYGIQEKKSYFPYEFLDNFEKLSYDRFPEYASFFSELRNVNVLEEEYIQWEKNGKRGAAPPTGREKYGELLEIWEQRGMSTLADFLMYYANLDTGPFVQAVVKLTQYYFGLNVDVFKVAISAPGVARKLLFDKAKKAGAFFASFSEQEADLFYRVKKCCFGGPSIVFKRYARVDSTYIRDNPLELCQSIAGYDCNAMYLKSLSEPLPVFFGVRRRAETQFKPEVMWKHIQMFQWMIWLAKSRKIEIRNKLNSHREFRMGPYLLDGWSTQNDLLGSDNAGSGDPEDNVLTECEDNIPTNCVDNVTEENPPPSPSIAKAYEFHGCWTHGHMLSAECHQRWKKVDGMEGGERVDKLDSMSDSTLKLLKTRAEHTAEKEAFIRSLNVDLEVIYECQFMALKKDDASIRECANDMLPEFYIQYPRPVSKEHILENVENGTLHGLIEVDIKVPEEWPEGKDPNNGMTPYEYFSEMSPIFCNADVPFTEWGPTMQQYSEEAGHSSDSRRLLIGGMSGKKIFLASNLLQWYLQKGLEVTKVYEVVEYKFKRCFTEFCDMITTARRQGDSDVSKEVLGETCKVLGNASYGSLLLDKTKHTNVKYVHDKTNAHLAVNSNLFKHMTELSDEMYEVELSKKMISLDVPIQLAFCILQTAKQLLLSFYYDGLDYFLPRSSFELTHADTDSLYLALSHRTLAEAVLPEKQAEFHHSLYGHCHDFSTQIPMGEDSDGEDSLSEVVDSIATPSPSGSSSLSPKSPLQQPPSSLVRMVKPPLDWFPRECCQEHAKYDKRTPGLFKLEASGRELIALASKTYHLDRFPDKPPCVKAKGINKTRIGEDSRSYYYNSLFEKKSSSVTNIGFRAHENTIMTYSQDRQGFSYFYIKREVQPNGIDTKPLLMELCPWEDFNVVVLDPSVWHISSDYPCMIQKYGCIFTSCTKLYLYEMALHHQRADIAHLILGSRTTSAMYALCKRFKTIPTWYEIRDRIMKETIALKIDIHKANIISDLQRCQGKIIVQPSTDRTERYWGCGLNKDMAQITAPAEFPGLNQMGAFWERLSNDVNFMNA